MKEIHTEVEINAPAERVWRMLTDFRAYPEWNPFVRRVDGEARVGARIHVDIQPSSGKKMSFRPTVLVADPEPRAQVARSPMVAWTVRWRAFVLDRITR